MISHKKKTIATWCLATVASTCLALSGVFYNAPMKASAEGLVQLETQNLISDVSSGVTVTANKSVNAASVTGLAVESESAYEGALNATFTGDLALGFIFPGAGANGGTNAGTQGDGNGAFQFIISDAEDSSKFFTINYVPQQVGSTWERVVSYVEYNDGTSNYVRTWNHSSGRGDKWVSSYNTVYDGYKQVAAFNNGTAEQNKLTFDWIDDPNTEEADQSVLTVSYQAKGRWGAETKTMIAFDGQTGELSGTVCAVPKISFENGYKISFKSTYGTGTDVCFTSIGDVSLAADAVDANVSTVEGSYLVNGEEIANGDTVIVEKGTELSVSGESVYTLMGLGSACDDVTVACAGVAVEYTGTYNKDVAGEYSLAIGDFTFKVKVVEYASVDVKDLVAPNDAISVTANQSFTDASSNVFATGLGIVPNANNYTAELAPTFTGDLTFQYLIPDTTGMVKADTYGGQSATGKFIISDAQDSSNYFTLDFFAGRSSNLSVGATYTKDGITYKRVNGYADTTVANYTYFRSTHDTWCSYQPSGTKTTKSQPNTIKLFWVDDVLKVAVVSSSGKDSIQIAFDGTNGSTASDGMVGANCGVPKINFPNGYKVSFASTSGLAICFTSIGDVNLASESSVRGEVTAAASDSYIVNGEEVANGGTVNTYVGEDVTVVGETNYALDGLATTATMVGAGQPVVYTGDFNKDVAGQYTLNVGDFAFTVNVKNAYKVQYSVNGELGNAQILDTENATITLADAPAAVEGKTFIGWSTAANVLYPAGVEYTVSGNVTITAVYMDMQMVAGASIRKSNPSGIRFSTKIAESDYNENYMTEMGTLIIPTDMLAGKAFTVEGLNGATHLNIVRTTWLSADSISGLKIANTDGYKLYAGVMTTVQQGNYTRDFSARGYVKVSYADETSVYFYTNYSETDNVRSVYEVATKSLDANEADTNGELSKIVNNVADITVTSDGSGFTVAKTNENATYTVSGSVDANGAASVTVNGNVQTLVVNGVNIFSETAVSVLVSETAYSLENAKIVNGEGTATITFDLGDAALQAALNGKTISFIGDSITTYKGISKCNNPWYGNTEASRGNTTMLYADTWWAQLMEGYGMELEANHSTGAISVVDRAVSHYGDVGSPDIVVVFMGTNDKDNFTIQNKEFTDLITSSNVEETLARAEKLVVGNQYAQWYNYSNETFNLDSFTFADAYYVMLRAIKAKNPNAKLVLVTTYAGEEVAAKNAVIKGFAEHFGAAVVDLENTELKTSVESDYALMDKENSVHPNEAGMDIITEAVADALRALYVEE